MNSQLERCLKHIFAKYCYPPPATPSQNGDALLEPPLNAFLSPEGLDCWVQDTNGAPFTQETKDELIEFLDMNDKGELT